LISVSAIIVGGRLLRVRCAFGNRPAGLGGSFLGAERVGLPVRHTDRRHNAPSYVQIPRIGASKNERACAKMIRCSGRFTKQAWQRPVESVLSVNPPLRPRDRVDSPPGPIGSRGTPQARAKCVCCPQVFGYRRSNGKMFPSRPSCPPGACPAPGPPRILSQLEGKWPPAQLDGSRLALA